jgi:DNA-binding FrmR family transcriptional regulator
MSESLLPLSTQSRAELATRLVRIEGQVRGVQRMLAEGRDCNDILTQLNAIKAAVSSVGTTMAERCAHEALCDGGSPQPPDVDRVLALLRASRT